MAVKTVSRAFVSSDCTNRVIGIGSLVGTLLVGDHLLLRGDLVELDSILEAEVFEFLAAAQCME